MRYAGRAVSTDNPPLARVQVDINDVPIVSPASRYGFTNLIQRHPSATTICEEHLFVLEQKCAIFCRYFSHGVPSLVARCCLNARCARTKPVMHTDRRLGVWCCWAEPPEPNVEATGAHSRELLCQWPEATSIDLHRGGKPELRVALTGVARADTGALVDQGARWAKGCRGWTWCRCRSLLLTSI